MGEMVINSMRGEIPVVTIRPSVIESTWRDPFPGWMEGNRYVLPAVYTCMRTFKLMVVILMISLLALLAKLLMNTG